MNKYENGKIYKIVCNITGLVYIGSTIEPTLAKRLTKHKSQYKIYNGTKSHSITSFKVLENNNYDIVLVESYPCKNKDELKSKERYYIETIECVNKQIPGRTIKEYYEGNKETKLEYQKKYYDTNKDLIIEKQSQYQQKRYQANKEVYLEKQRKYRLKKRLGKNNNLDNDISDEKEI